MHDVEHDGRPIAPLFLRIFLTLLSVTIGLAARAEADSLAEAESLVAGGKIEEAREMLGRLAEHSAGNDAGRVALFRRNELVGEGEAYVAGLLRLAETQDGPAVRLALGKYRYVVGAYRAAARDFRRAARDLSGEERREALCWQGISLAAAGALDEGLDVLLETARKEGRAALRARYLAATVYWNRRDLDRCAPLLESLLDGEHDFLRPALLLDGRLLEARGENGAARRRYAEVASRFPGSREGEEARQALRLLIEAVDPLPGFYVQVAAFEKRENARRFVAARRAEGIGAIEVHAVEREGKALFPVRIGPFETAEGAERARENLELQGIAGQTIEVTVEREE